MGTEMRNVVRLLYLPLDQVDLISIGAKGTAVSVRITNATHWYTVDYWWEGRLCQAEVLARELQDVPLLNKILGDREELHDELI